MKLDEIRDVLKATILTGEDQLDKVVIMACGGSDRMDDILAAVAKGSVLLTGLTTEDVVRTAIVTGIGAVVFVRGKRPEPNVIEMARASNLPTMVTSYSMFVSCGRLYMNGMRGLNGSW